MKTSKKNSEIVNDLTQINVDEESMKCLNFQLDFLKSEFTNITESVKRIDDITQTIKNWTIIIWLGSISFSISQSYLQPYIYLTASIPLLFWMVESTWRRIQRKFIFRLYKISDFINSDKLRESFKEGKLIDFKVLDPTGIQYRQTDEFIKIIGFFRTMLVKPNAPFYIALILLTLIIGSIFKLK